VLEGRRAMRMVTSPVAQFLVAGLAVVAVTLVGTVWLSARAAAQEAVADARAMTEVLARSVAEPALPLGLVNGRAGAIDRFDRAALSRLLVDDVRRIKIWASDGTIVYSDETRLIGSRYPLGADERAVLRHGDSDAEFSDLSRPENRFEAGSGGLLEVYTRVISPEGEPLLFEAYFSAADLADRRQEIVASFRPVVLGAPLGLLVLTTPLVWGLTRRLRTAADGRERLLRAAVDASDSERRRIARDLHDGVVQDLAGSAFAIAAEARAADADPGLRQRLTSIGADVRRSLRALRSLLVEIYPPDLRAEGLPAALEDLVAPAAGAGIAGHVDVAGSDSLTDDEAALVWRVAQEAVRNAVRHAHPRSLRVRVRADAVRVELEVRDDGAGFDLASDRARGREHLGLRGLRDLIREAGGRIDVSSAPGAGTTVRLEVTRP
jgi:signal transduction histidine kinase